MALFDDIFDEYPLHPSLRIPPLIDPLPFVSATLDRPSPLEPNARVDANIDKETAKLTGRRKALAEAKPLGDAESSDLPLLPKGSQNDLRPIQKSPRKRQKLHDHEHIADFVQLPKPKAKAKEDKPPPFQPVSILNELHEPPPSAALFPPITPIAMLSETGWKVPDETAETSMKSRDPCSAKKTKNKEERGEDSMPRRVYLRPYRLKWTEPETDQLVKGVAIYGMGKWKKILQHPEFSFQQGRTPVDLKDRFRTCFPQKVLDKSRTGPIDDLSQQRCDSSDGPRDGSDIPFTALNSQNPNQAVPSGNSSSRRGRRSPGPNRKRARRKPWSAAEDEALAEGYRIYGFQWTQIAKDPSLSFSNRTGNQVRDRFRLKYPELYGGDGAAASGASPMAILAAGGRPAPKTTATRSAAKVAEMCSQNEINPAVIATVAATDNYDDYGDDDDDSVISDSDNEDFTNDNPNPLPEPLQKSLLTEAAAAAAAVAPKPPAAASYDITNLLNDDDQEDTRPLASFRFAPWDDHVTLPPMLLWEDMATRPMFDLE